MIFPRVLLGLALCCLFLAGPPFHAPAFAQSEAPIDQSQGEGDPAPEQIISLEASPARDRAIEERLEGIFANLEGLEQITIAVSSGVVQIGGEIGSSGARDQVLSIARKLEGVAEVVDAMVLDRDVERRLAPAIDEITGWSRDLVTYLPLALIAFLIVLLFWLIAKASSAFRWIYRRLAPNAFVAKLVGQVVQIVILLAGVFVALSVLDASGVVQTVLGAAGLLGLALSFALRDTTENYISSILLSLRQPFQPNDEVLIEGHEGRVVRLTSRATVLLTLDGNHVRIPNATVFKGVIVNFTRKPERRIGFTIGVDTGADLLEAQALAVATLEAAEGVLSEPPPSSLVQELGDSSVVLWIGGWVDQRRFDYRKVRSEALRLVKEAFDDAAIEMPEPIYRLRIEQGGGTGPQELNSPARPPARKRSANVVRARLDLGRDQEIDESVADERSDSQNVDLLDARAPKE
ncbi:MAG: mechanosensitive ion channel domain-containing protein [Geminicoccaceae bacterium]